MTFITNNNGHFESDEPFPCPECRRSLKYGHSWAIASDHEEPRSGDYGFCQHCAAIFILSDNLEPVEPSLDEMIRLQAHTKWPELEYLTEQIKGGSQHNRL